MVFSDEFNVDGRTFWPGDDPWWEAVDLWYWGTRDLQWYSPDAITTRDGKLEILMTQEPTNGLNFRSGMLQSWNKLCFTGGYIEVSMSFPGDSKIMGYWPGAWTLGNLGRPGYGGTNHGVWPYTYNSCERLRARVLLPCLTELRFQAMSARFPIRRGLTAPILSPRNSQETGTTEESCPGSQDNVYLRAPVQERIILGLRTMSAVELPRVSETVS